MCVCVCVSINVSINVDEIRQWAIQSPIGSYSSSFSWNEHREIRGKDTAKFRQSESILLLDLQMMS